MSWKITIRNKTTIQIDYLFVIPFQECIPFQGCMPRLKFVFNNFKILNYISEMYFEIDCYSYLLFHME
jgi:hypothetical protein